MASKSFIAPYSLAVCQERLDDNLMPKWFRQNTHLTFTLREGKSPIYISGTLSSQTPNTTLITYKIQPDLGVKGIMGLFAIMSCIAPLMPKDQICIGFGLIIMLVIVERYGFWRNAPKYEARIKKSLSGYSDKAKNS